MMNRERERERDWLFTTCLLATGDDLRFWLSCSCCCSVSQLNTLRVSQCIHSHTCTPTGTSTVQRAEGIAACVTGGSTGKTHTSWGLLCSLIYTKAIPNSCLFCLWGGETFIHSVLEFGLGPFFLFCLINFYWGHFFLILCYTHRGHAGCFSLILAPKGGRTLLMSPPTIIIIIIIIIMDIYRAPSQESPGRLQYKWNTQMQPPPPHTTPPPTRTCMESQNCHLIPSVCLLSLLFCIVLFHPSVFFFSLLLLARSSAYFSEISLNFFCFCLEIGPLFVVVGIALVVFYVSG